MRLFFSVVLLALCRHLAPAAGAPTKVPCPGRDCLAPDVALDAATGTLHCVYGTSTKAAIYQRSQDGGATWSPPLVLSDARRVTTTMGERGPKLSVPAGASGQLVYVLWPDLWSPGVQTHARLVVSRNGGQSFTAPQQASDRWGIDGATLAADAAGGVLVAYHWLNASYPRPPNATEATWLLARSSRDYGATWTGEAFVTTSATSVACSMCQMRARGTGVAGAFELAFRSAANNVREHYLLQATLDVTSTWQAQRIPGPGWAVDSCPMSGPELELGSSSSSSSSAFSGIMAFMSTDANQVFWSGRSAATGGFSPPVGTPPACSSGGGGGNERYPTALHSAQLQQVLMVWNVGPMAVSGTAQVQWATFGEDGRPTGECGTLGTSFAGTRATAWVDAAGAFSIMTTAV